MERPRPIQFQAPACGPTIEAFAYLKQAIDESDAWILWLNTEPKLDNLRADERFQKLLKRANFPA